MVNMKMLGSIVYTNISPI